MQSAILSAAAAAHGAGSGGWSYMTAVSFCLLAVLAARATYDLELYSFRDWCSTDGMSAQAEAANNSLRRWHGSLLRVLSGAPAACKQQVLIVVDDEKARWTTHRAQYQALQGPGNWEPQLDNPDFPGRILYMKLLSDPANTMRGWKPTVIVAACEIMMELRAGVDPNKQPELSDLYICSCIMDDPSTRLAGLNRFGSEFKSLTFMLTTTVMFAASGDRAAALRLYKEYLEGVSSDSEYCREHKSLEKALYHNARTLQTRMVRTYPATGRLSDIATPSVRTALTNSAAALPAEDANDITLELDALFASCTISPVVQSVTGQAAT